MRRGLAVGVALVLGVAGLFLWTRGGERAPEVAHPADPTRETEREMADLSPAERPEPSDVPEAREVIDVRAETEPSYASEETTEEKTAAVLRGQVVDAETGAPLTGATVFDPSFTMYKVRSGPDGLFRFPFSKAEYKSLRIEHEGYFRTFVAIRPGQEDLERVRTIGLERSASLHVTVVRHGVLVSGLDVRLSTRWLRSVQDGSVSKRGGSKDYHWEARTGPDGVARLEALPPRNPLAIELFDAGIRIPWLAIPVELEPGEERELEIRIDAGCSLHGVAAQPGGVPVTGLEVWLTPARSDHEVRYYREHEGTKPANRATTIAGGAFRLDAVAAGDWYVGVAPQEIEQGRPAPLAKRITIAPGELERDVTLDVHLDLFVRGFVRNPDGTPAEGALVHALGTGYSKRREGDAFALGPLAPGEVELFALSQKDPSLARSERVFANAGDEDVVITLRAGAAITGRCVDGAGQPWAARVELAPQDRKSAGSWSIGYGRAEDGRFAFSGLVPGVYHVRAVDDHGHVGVRGGVIAQAGRETSDVNVVQHAGAIVHVRVEHAETHGQRPWVRLLQGGVEVALGTGDSTVPPGPLTVALCIVDPETQELRSLETRAVTAVEGQTVEVVF